MRGRGPKRKLAEKISEARGLSWSGDRTISRRDSVLSDGLYEVRARGAASMRGFSRGWLLLGSDGSEESVRKAR